MNISEFQKYVAAFSTEKGFHNTTVEQRAMYMVSEVGELTEAIVKKNPKREIGREMFDVIWNVFDLANKLDIDMEKAFEDKMLINKEREWDCL
ncbi:nucleotide pyrophosphohydrolase [Bacillus phage Nachito]|nr:nucleotide pyrophosphohydrolase [Bacillus phage Nachito]